MPEVLARFDENIVWHVPGRSAISGDYCGHQEVMGFFGQPMEMSGGTFRLELHDLLASDDHVVVLVKASVERNGVPYSLNATHEGHRALGPVHHPVRGRRVLVLTSGR